MTARPPRVVEAGLRTFACAYDGYVEDPVALGTMVAVREGPNGIFGIVAEVTSGPEDPTRPLHPVGGPEPAVDVFARNPHILPLLRTTVVAVTCGHVQGEVAVASLPPHPPPLMALVHEATHSEITRIAADGAFLSLLTGSPLSDDSVVAAAIRCAAPAFDDRRSAFMVAAGKELARLLRAEPARLATILRSVAP
jgi:hypothetical protein